jgi:hypothetical protein
MLIIRLDGFVVSSFNQEVEALGTSASRKGATPWITTHWKR